MYDRAQMNCSLYFSLLGKGKKTEIKICTMGVSILNYVTGLKYFIIYISCLIENHILYK